MIKKSLQIIKRRTKQKTLEDDKDNCSKIEINEKKDELKEDEKDVEKKEDTKKRRKRKNKNK